MCVCVCVIITFETKVKKKLFYRRETFRKKTQLIYNIYVCV